MESVEGDDILSQQEPDRVADLTKDPELDETAAVDDEDESDAMKRLRLLAADKTPRARPTDLDDELDVGDRLRSLSTPSSPKKI